MKELYLDDKLFTGTEEEFLAVNGFVYKEWRLNGKLHRINGPAVIRPCGTQEWYQNGRYHRADGPAVIYSGIYSGGHRGSWYIEGFDFCKFFNKFFPNFYVFINNIEK